jgi:hypothetical protein
MHFVYVRKEILNVCQRRTPSIIHHILGTEGEPNDYNYFQEKYFEEITTSSKALVLLFSKLLLPFSMPSPSVL